MTKLTNEQRERLKNSFGDWEIYHSERDLILKERLRELDPEFVADLEQETDGGTFWFA